MRRTAFLPVALAALLLVAGAAALAPDGASRAAVPTARTAAGPSCFAAPGSCGYPDPRYHNVGPARRCAALRRSGPLTITRAGSRVANLDVVGKLVVRAPNVTIDNVCVTVDAGGALNSAALVLEGGAANAVITHSTVAGADRGRRSVEMAVANWGGRPAVLTRDYFHNCGECIHDGPWTVRDTYVISNGMVGTSDHYEDVYCSNTSISMIHDTILNPQWQTATVFCDTNEGAGGACRNHLSISRSLLAGGDFVLYACGNASSVGTSTLRVTDNRFARCRTAPFTYDRRTGGNTCAGGADRHGYFPYGGYFGINDSAYCGSRSRTWAHNVWDDNGSPVRC